MADDRKKVSTYQLKILLNAIESDPTLIMARTGSNKLKNEYTDKWIRLAEQLNSVENGVYKDVHKWQQAWRDWKSNTKKKAYKIWKQSNEHEGGTQQELNELELRLISLFDSEMEHQVGIDISNITEVDPLSSNDEESNNGTSETNPGSHSPDIVSVFDDIGGDENCKTQILGKRSKTVEDDVVNAKKNRLKSTCSYGAEDNTDYHQRLSTLEQAQLETNKHQTVLLEALVNAMERQTAAAIRQADAVEKQTKLFARLTKLLQDKLL